MAYLITGGRGFIGCYVLRELLERGQEAISYDLAIGPPIIDLILTEEQQNQVTFVQGDITDALHLMNTVKTHGVNKIIHLASLQIPAANANPPLGVQIVALGTVNVLEAARILELEKVVWASSIAVFGPPEKYEQEWLPNDAPQFSTSVYGACKSLDEFLAGYYFNTYGVDSVGFRFSAVYGVGRLVGKSSFTTKMIEAVALGQPYTVPFGDDTVDWQYVEDVASLIVEACERPPTKTRVFNTKGDVRPVKDGVEYLRKLAPDAQLTVEPGVFGISWKLDTTKLEEELGFCPAHTMEQGILKTFNTFRSQAGLGTVSR